MIGLPAADGRQRMSWNLLTLRDATARHTSSCWAARTLTQKPGPDSRSAFHELDALSGRKATKGGSNDTDVNEPTVMPSASPCHLTEVFRVHGCPFGKR